MSGNENQKILSAGKIDTVFAVSKEDSSVKGLSSIWNWNKINSECIKIRFNFHIISRLVQYLNQTTIASSMPQDLFILWQIDKWLTYIDSNTLCSGSEEIYP